MVALTQYHTIVMLGGKALSLELSAYAAAPAPYRYFQNQAEQPSPNRVELLKRDISTFTNERFNGRFYA
jgi:hypothetical protein